MAEHDPPPQPLSYARADGPSPGQQVAAVAAFLGGLVVGPAVVAVAGVGTALVGNGGGLKVIAAVWFAAAVLLGVGLFAALRRGRRLPRDRGAAGRSFLLGLLIGGLVMALVEGTCFAHITSI